MGPEDTMLMKEARYQDRISKEMSRRSKSRAEEGGLVRVSRAGGRDGE